MGQIYSLEELQIAEIERKQARRWRDWQREIATPLMDKVLAVPHRGNGADWKRLLRTAALIDTHLQRAGAKSDLPQTHSAYLAAFQEEYIAYLAKH